MKKIDFKVYCLFFLFSTCYFPSLAQESNNQILGLVIDAQTKIALPRATVYLDQSTRSTFTTDSGTFVLKVPSGNYILIVSCVGYKPFSLPLDKQNKTKLLVELIPDTKTLNEVAITADSDRELYLSLFKGFFLGKNVRQCNILNPEVMSFNYTNDTYILTAVASEPLIIENLVLGYRLHYDLISFRHYAGRTSYRGHARYEEMSSKNSKELKLWETNREQSYLGSSQHFMQALANNQVKDEGFVVKKLIKTPTSPTNYTIHQKWQGNEFKANDTVVTMSWNGISYSATDTTTFADSSHKSRIKKEYNVLYPSEIPKNHILFSTSANDIFEFSFTNSLFITYKKKKTSINFWGYGGDNPSSFITSIITMLVPETTIDSHGNLADPNAILYEGYWARLRSGDQLPFDYEPTTKKPKKKIE